LALTIALKPIAVMTGSNDRDGRLVLVNGELVAVLVQLDSAAHGDQRGCWFLEAGFGPCNSPSHPVFRDLEDAQAWVVKRLRA